MPRQGLYWQGLHRQRLYRGGRCADEDWKYTGGLFIWRTPANTTAGRKSRRNWPGKVASELSDCSQAVESGWRSMSNARGAGNQRRRPASADQLERDARERGYGLSIDRAPSPRPSPTRGEGAHRRLRRFSIQTAKGNSVEPSLRANGSRECAPDDRLHEAIHLAA